MATDKMFWYDEDGWIDIYNMFQELFISSFRWDGLPDELNARYIEQSLFLYGKACFFSDEDVNQYICLRFMPNSSLDIYGEPKRINAIGINYQKTKTVGLDAIPIYNNFTREVPIKRLQTYAMRIHHIENTSDINVNAQKTPYIIKTSKDTEFTMKKIFKQINEFIPAIFVTKSMDDNPIEVLGTNAPYVVDKLEDQKRKLINEALSYIGIDNNSSEKNERLLADEIMVSNGLAIANRNSRLQCREMAVEKINKMFGLNVSVTFNNPSFFADPYAQGRNGIDVRNGEGDTEQPELIERGVV